MYRPDASVQPALSGCPGGSPECESNTPTVAHTPDRGWPVEASVTTPLIRPPRASAASIRNDVPEAIVKTAARPASGLSLAHSDRCTPSCAWNSTL